MTVSIVSSGDNACTMHEKTPSCSAAFPIPCSKLARITLMRSMLADPDRSDAEAGPVSVSRYRDGVKVHYGSGSFAVRYHDVFPVVMEG